MAQSSTLPRYDLAELDRRLKGDLDRLAAYLRLEVQRRERKSTRYRFAGSIIEIDQTGFWRDWSDAQAIHGGPLRLIQHVAGVGFKEALEIAGNLTGLRPSENPAPRPAPNVIEYSPSSRSALRQDRRKAVRTARKIWNSAGPVTADCAGWIYIRNTRLIRLQVEALDPERIRFHPNLRQSVNLGDDKNPDWRSEEFPALLFLVKDVAGQITGVQIVYLTEDGRKAEWYPEPNGEAEPAKKSRGLLKGGGFRIAGPDADPSIGYLVEGPEKALAVLAETGGLVVSALGVSNYAAQSWERSIRTIVIVADGDEPGSPAWKASIVAADQLTLLGFEVRIARCPEGEDADSMHAKDPGSVKRLIDAATVHVPFSSFMRAATMQPSEASDALRKDILATGAELFAQSAARRDYEERWLAHITLKQIETIELTISLELPTDGKLWMELSDIEQAIHLENRAEIMKRRRRIAKMLTAEIARDHPGVDLKAVHNKLYTGSQGIGKTDAVLRMLEIELRKGRGAEQTVWVMQPTFAKAEEFAEDAHFPVTLVRGRSAKRDLNAYPIEDDDLFDSLEPNQIKMCQRHEAAATIASLGVSVTENLCFKSGKECPFAKDCAYLKQRDDLEGREGGVFVMSHAYYHLPSPAPKADIVIVDESLLGNASGSAMVTVEQATSTAGWTQTGIESLNKALDYRTDAIKAVGILQDSTEPLAELREFGLEKVKGLYKFAAARENDVLSTIDPETTDAEIEAITEEVKAAGFRSVTVLWRSIMRELEALPDPEDRGVIHGVVSIPNSDQLIAYYPKTPRIQKSTSVLYLDGTADQDLLERALDREFDERRYTARRQLSRAVFVDGRGFSKQSLTGEGLNGKWKADADRFQQELKTFLAGLAQRKSVFAAMPMKAEQALGLPDPIMTGHYGAMRGLNIWQHCEVAVVVGREQPAPWDVEAAVRPFIITDPEPLKTTTRYAKETRAIQLESGRTHEIEVEVHPDPRAQAMLEQIREAEILQAIDRVRSIHKTREVYLLSPVATDIVFTDVLRWGELLLGGTRADRAMQESGGILPLSGRLLSKVSPSTFPSFGAANSWLQRARDTIDALPHDRFWVADVRLPGSTRHSTVLFDRRNFRDHAAGIDALSALLGYSVLINWQPEKPRHDEAKTERNSVLI